MIDLARLPLAVIVSCALVAPGRAQSGDEVPMVLFAYMTPTPGANIVLSAAGDADGDGLPDFAVADPFSNFGLVKNGVVRIRSGRDGSLLQEFFGTQPNAHLGAAMAAAGDIDHDGISDVLVAGKGTDPLTNAETTARVFSCHDGQVLFEIPSDPAIGFAASSLCGARDVDGDGFADVIVGCPVASPNGSNSGTVRVYSGATHQILYEFDGAAADEYVGTSVASADVNGDGCEDIIVGAPGVALSNGHVGSALVFSGKDGSLLATLDAPPKYSFDPDVYGTGSLVCAPGDLDHDGTPDVGVLIDGWGNFSYLRVFSGKTWTALLDVGDGGYSNWIQSVDGAGDIDGDGTLDVMVGNQSGDIPSVVRVYSGNNGSILQSYKLGWRATRLGDLDGDGFPDLGVGAYKARVISGAPSHWTKWGWPTLDNGLLEIDAYATFGAGTPARVALRFAPPGTTAWLVIGLNAIQQPFHGTLLFVSPDVVIDAHRVNADGEIQIQGTWPPGIPPGFEILFTFMTVGGAPSSPFLQTGALKATVP